MRLDNSIPILLMTVLSAVGLTGNPIAQSPHEDRLRQKFEAADTDHDGKLTRQEAKVGMPKVYQNFDRIDRTRKGYITLSELLEARRAIKGQQ